MCIYLVVGLNHCELVQICFSHTKMADHALLRELVNNEKSIMNMLLNLSPFFFPGLKRGYEAKLLKIVPYLKNILEDIFLEVYLHIRYICLLAMLGKVILVLTDVLTHFSPMSHFYTP